MNYKGKHFCLFVMVALSVAISICSVYFAQEKPEIVVESGSKSTIAPTYYQPPIETSAVQSVEVPTSTQNPVDEPEKEQIRIYDSIALDEELQRLVWQACEETGCPYELALSVIFCESSYRNINGDGGNSIGYMQIQPKWHQERMEKLGVTDLSDPLSNFRVGCDLLAELLDKHSVEDALSVYNTGGTGHRKYANKVLSYMEETFG